MSKQTLSKLHTNAKWFKMSNRTSAMIPKDLLPIIGQYTFPSVDDFCASLNDKKDMMRVIDLLLAKLVTQDNYDVMQDVLYYKLMDQRHNACVKNVSTLLRLTPELKTLTIFNGTKLC